jgi:type I restriction enzyme, S subunit
MSLMGNSKRDDLLITCKGTIGKMIIQDTGEAHIACQIMRIRTFSYINNSFLKYLLAETVSELKSNAKSMIPEISRDDIL